jgi:uncharacterized protein VcgC/VcgE DUF2780
MKSILLFIVSVVIATNVHAGWSDAASSLLGQADKETSTQAIDYAKGLLPALKGATQTSGAQASGGAGSLFSLVKENLDAEDFSSLQEMVPQLNMDKILAAAPEVSGQNNSMTSMLGGDSGDALANAQKVYEQFKSLGLTKEQLGQYIDVTQGYLQSEGGQAAVDLFKKGLGSLAGI